jgi:hypothetical protein
MSLTSISFVLVTVIDLLIVTILLYIGCGTRRTRRTSFSPNPVTWSSTHQIVPTKPTDPTKPTKPTDSTTRRPSIQSVDPALALTSELDQTAQLLFNASSQFRQQIMSMQQDTDAQKFTEALFENLNPALTQALHEIESETLSENTPNKIPHNTPTLTHSPSSSPSPVDDKTQSSSSGSSPP